MRHQTALSRTGTNASSCLLDVPLSHIKKINQIILLYTFGHKTHQEQTTTTTTAKNTAYYLQIVTSGFQNRASFFALYRPHRSDSPNVSEEASPSPPSPPPPPPPNFRPQHYHLSLSGENRYPYATFLPLPPSSRCSCNRAQERGREVR